MTISAEQLKLGKEILEGLIEAMGFTEYTIYEDQLESRQILAIAVEDHAVLIGRRGDNLHALQQLFNALLKHKDPSAPYITIDVANYKKDRIEKVMRIAEDAAQKVQDYGKEYSLNPMNAFERRIVHMVLADKSDLETESVGEDPHRKVVVRPRAEAPAE
jgi:spoIIIJ-associated protein